MVGPPCFDWSGYFRSQREEQLHSLASWLAANGVGVREFMEIVERAYAAAPHHWQERPERFVARCGRPAAAYARRKRRFTGLNAALDLALMSGALRGEVAPEELDVRGLPRPKQRRAEEVLAALEHAIGGTDGTGGRRSPGE